MTQRNKRGLDDIKGFLEQQSKEQWLHLSTRRSWPHYLYHYTDIKNVVSVLKEGILHSRGHLERNNIVFSDTGSHEVLRWTDNEVIVCVRLTFRPLTPTQYHHEGIKTQVLLNSGDSFARTHSPVPVFLIFDAVQVLSRQETLFAEVGLARVGASRLSTSEELINLPWKDIYGIGPLKQNDPEKATKNSRRNAEVIIPKHLDLDSLRSIHCRSVAEQETLLHLLSDKARRKYAGIITSTRRESLFHRKRSFVTQVILGEEGAIINFWPDTHCPGPYNIKINIHNLSTKQRLTTVAEREAIGVMKVPFIQSIAEYRFELYLDDFLAYANSYESKEMVF